MATEVEEDHKKEHMEERSQQGNVDNRKKMEATAQDRA